MAAAKDIPIGFEAFSIPRARQRRGEGDRFMVQYSGLEYRAYRPENQSSCRTGPSGSPKNPEEIMNDSSYQSSLEKGIKHLGNRWDPEAVEFLNENLGSRLGCLNVLFSDSKSQSLRSWFALDNLEDHKQWAYVAAKIQRMIFQAEPWRWLPAFAHLFPLLSDNENVINWYSRHRLPFFVEDEERGNEAVNKDDVNRVAFHSYQLHLALLGKWGELHERCEKILSAPETPEGKDFLIDHRFYLALAEGNKPAMEVALNRLTSPDLARIRNFGVAFGLTENLIATHATIYAKVAWRSGYEVEIDSPWVPREWLPVKPLNNYDEPWPFLQDFDVWQPFEGDWAVWSPQNC